jgi:ABC-type amino acid transport substrate-binding protein
MKEDLGIGKLTISVIATALLANIAAADAQQASDPRVADLVQAGMVRVGLFSTQYTKDLAFGELRGVRVDIARALAAQIGVQCGFRHGFRRGAD